MATPLRAALAVYILDGYFPLTRITNATKKIINSRGYFLRPTLFAPPLLPPPLHDNFSSFTSGPWVSSRAKFFIPRAGERVILAEFRADFNCRLKSPAPVEPASTTAVNHPGILRVSRTFVPAGVAGGRPLSLSLSIRRNSAKSSAITGEISPGLHFRRY